MARGEGAFTPEVKRLIYDRAHGRCERCGLQAQTGHFHHRTPRRAGGTSNPRLGLPSNGVLLHPSCHDWIEKHRNVAAQLGFLVGMGSDSWEQPIMLWSGWVYLNDDGTLTRLGRVPATTERRSRESGSGEGGTDIDPLTALEAR